MKKIKTPDIALAGALFLLLPISTTISAQDSAPTSAEFLSEAQQVLPAEKPYDYHKRLKAGPIHQLLRLPDNSVADGEMSIPDKGWKIVIAKSAGAPVQFAAKDVSEFFDLSMQTEVKVETALSLDDWEKRKNAIVAGTEEQLPGFEADLRTGKDYAIRVTPDRIVVCGKDSRGVMFGLFNLEARLGLRGGPFLPADLDTVRHSLYQNRMAISWLGFMQWPDTLLSEMAHAGFDAIFTSVYSNPNGVPGPPHYDIIRQQTEPRLNDVIRRAEAHGLKVYTPILFNNTREPESKEALRAHVRDIVTKFPEIRGYVLLTEGFYFEKFFGAGGHGKQDLDEWGKYWTEAVRIVCEECHAIDPAIEVLPWEYNIDFRPYRAPLKRKITSMLPKDSIPLLTWENGKGFELDGLHGYLRDYSISQVGPAEVSEAQIEEAGRRGMDVYCKVDTFATWQFGTTPYLPVPQQWQKRYDRLAEYGVDGTLETWSNGFKPNFIADLRAWSCWTDSLDFDTLLQGFSRKQFGPGNEESVIAAWQKFSDAIRKVPDTGPSMGTNSSVSNPLWFDEPPSRIMTLHNSWWDEAQMMHWRHRMVPYWPFAHHIMVFQPDFTNKRNAAESYARARSGIGSRPDFPVPPNESVLPVFQKYLLLAADGFEDGLGSYRRAALDAIDEKKATAMREVLLVEQMQRMLRSTHAILEFEDLRFHLHGKDALPLAEQEKILARMDQLVREEIGRTEAALATSRLDSRLGYENEMDYVYTPFVLEQKLWVLHKTLDEKIPTFRKGLTE